MMISSHHSANDTDPEQLDKLRREVWGPQAVDQFIRQAVSTCWMMLPPEQKTAEAVEREIRRLVDRAMKDFREDMAAFGITAAPSAGRKTKRS